MGLDAGEDGVGFFFLNCKMETEQVVGDCEGKQDTHKRMNASRIQ